MRETERIHPVWFEKPRFSFNYSVFLPPTPSPSRMPCMRFIQHQHYRGIFIRFLNYLRDFLSSTISFSQSSCGLWIRRLDFFFFSLVQSWERDILIEQFLFSSSTKMSQQWECSFSQRTHCVSIFFFKFSKKRMNFFQFRWIGQPVTPDFWQNLRETERIHPVWFENRRFSFNYSVLLPPTPSPSRMPCMRFIQHQHYRGIFIRFLNYLRDFLSSTISFSQSSCGLWIRRLDFFFSPVQSWERDSLIEQFLFSSSTKMSQQWECSFFQRTHCVSIFSF
jgi:hypothetical protein